MANYFQTLLGPIAPGISPTVNPLAVLGAGMYSGDPAGALLSMGQLQQAGQQLATQQMMNQQTLARQAAEYQLKREKHQAAIDALNTQRTGALALVDMLAPQAGQAAESEEANRRRAGLAAFAASDPTGFWAAYGKSEGPFEQAAAFEGTGMPAQTYNTLLELGPKIESGEASKLEQQKYNLAYQSASRPTRQVTPEGTFTQPGIDLAQFPTPAGFQPQAGPPPFTPKPLTAAEYKEQTTTEITSRLVSEIDAALAEGAETGPMAALKAHSAATPWLSWAVNLEPQEAKLASNLGALEKMLIAAMRGAQVGPQEEASFRKTLPVLGQSDELFSANLQTTKQNIADLMRRGEQRQQTSQTPSGAQTISNDDEFDALPSGALFVGPDGIERRKP